MLMILYEVWSTSEMPTSLELDATLHMVEDMWYNFSFIIIFDKSFEKFHFVSRSFINGRDHNMKSTYKP